MESRVAPLWCARLSVAPGTRPRRRRCAQRARVSLLLASVTGWHGGCTVGGMTSHHGRMTQADCPPRPRIAALIRDATDADLEAIARIYAQHVKHGLASFEEVPPAVEDLRSRRAAVLQAGLPYLAAELRGEVVGYAYAGAYRSRPGYRYTIEDSVYLEQGLGGLGLGTALLTTLIERC